MRFVERIIYLVDRNNRGKIIHNPIDDDRNFYGQRNKFYLLKLISHKFKTLPKYKIILPYRFILV